MKIKTHTKAGRITQNHNRLVIRTAVRAGDPASGLPTGKR